MAAYDIDSAYGVLMSPTPYGQASAAAMIRNFASAASLMADHLRASGAKAAGAGDAGAAAHAKAQAHAQWFDQVASNSHHAAGQLDRLVSTGNEHQATAEQVYATHQQVQARAAAPGHTDRDDVSMLHSNAQGSSTLNAAIDDWGSKYSGFSAPTAPPVPHSGGGAPVDSGGSGSAVGAGGAGSGAAIVASGAYTGSHASASAHDTSGYATPQPIDRGAGAPGSIEVGSDGGDFAGWYHDPRTGYYVDPSTGREFDPVTSRWVDPVTGQPFGDVTRYATSLEGAAPASTAAGLLATGSGAIGAGGGAAGGAAIAGGGGSFGTLFSGGNLATISGSYGGAVPPSLTTGSAATTSLFQQAGRSLEVKQQMAGNLLAREQAARAGHPYMPPMQGGGQGANAGGAAGRRRPGYLTADLDEAALFSSPARRSSDDEDDEPDERSRIGSGDDDLFAAATGSSGVLGESDGS